MSNEQKGFLKKKNERSGPRTWPRNSAATKGFLHSLDD